MSEMDVLSNVKTFSKTSGSSVKNINTAMKQLGIQNDGLNKAMTLFMGSFRITTGVMGLINLAHSKTIFKTIADRLRMSAEIAANSHPAGWWKIALGIGAAFAVSVGLGILINKINVGKFDLSSPLGRSEATSAVAAVV